ncbi:hypothetical protein H9M94_00985 [Mycoplasma sp. Pen4]|uniref:hypothetical protein n=1 Tax=Mycoplasma sp. Pen4 TaxID=640330 RepID=UPI0016545BFF|nr:hypothetical protein [Mycoplasma sp. Pen4]QNM93833.1 hypothetical protein H9M94_00985 [Mycoplasma sp. Pen4]
MKLKRFLLLFAVTPAVTTTPILAVIYGINIRAKIDFKKEIRDLNINEETKTKILNDSSVFSLLFN